MMRIWNLLHHQRPRQGVGRIDMAIPFFNARFDAPECIPKSVAMSHLGWRWTRLRRKYLMTRPYCERCGLLGEQVHHIQHRETHPELIYTWSNLMTLCKDCHYLEHKNDENQHTLPIHKH